jgi:predicted transposase YdaD
LLYKFPQMSREEVEAMFTLGDLKKTRVYWEAKLEGKLECEKIGAQRGQILGLKQGLKQAVVRLLTRKFGKVTLKTVKRLDKLAAE